jgi:hypothetical protein
MVNFFTLVSYAQEISAKTDTIPKQLRTIDNNYKERYLNDNAYDYTDEPSLFEQIKQWIISKIIEFFNTSDVDAAKIFKTIKLIFYIVVLLGVIYILIKIFLNKEVRWIFKKNPDSGQILQRGIVEDISDIDFKDLIEKAVKNKDFRLAVRYYYLWLLKGLDRVSLIHYDVEKTNMDYQTELSDSSFSEDFKRASYYYSYIWYGEFLIGKEEFIKTSAVYNKLLKQIENV